MLSGKLVKISLNNFILFDILIIEKWKFRFFSMTCSATYLVTLPFYKRKVMVSNLAKRFCMIRELYYCYYSSFGTILSMVSAKYRRYNI